MENLSEEVLEKLVVVARDKLTSSGEFKMDQGVVRGRSMNVFSNASKSLPEWYARQFPKFREQIWVVYQDERLTFGDVESKMKAFGHVLRHRFGVQPGDRVALSMRNYPEWCVTFLAVTSIGAVIVPLNSWWKDQEFLYGLQDSGAMVLVADEERLQRARLALDNLPHVRAVGVRLPPAASFGPQCVRYEELMDSVSGVASPSMAPLDPDGPAAIMYTSGTTGHPKGVILTHRGILSQMMYQGLRVEIAAAMAEAAAAPPPAHPPCMVCPVPLFHVTGSNHIFLASLVSGQKLCLMFKWDPAEALRLIEEERATAWTGVPTMVQDLMEHPSFASTDTSSLLSIGGGGAPTPASQAEKSARKFKSAAPSQGYGLTETNGAFCTIGGPFFLSRPTSTGRAYFFMDAKIVDRDTAEDLPVGEDGEIVIKGPLVMAGYWNKPQATAKCFTPEGYFRTGDVGHMDSGGYVYITDRAKDLVIRGGENISCAEVESAVYRHSAVMECAAYAVKHERLGEEVGLAVYFKQGCTASAEEISAAAAQHLAKFKVPAPGNIVLLNEPLPRGATGKILKRALRDQANTKRAHTSRL